MKYLWMYIDKQPWQEETKYRAVLWILGILSAIVGCAVWLVVRRWALGTPDWMLCFIGCPVVLACYIVFFYSCRHDFHDSSSDK